MSIKVPDASERILLTALLNALPVSAGKVHLHTSTLEPSDNDTHATYSGFEANYTGYAAQALTGGAVAVSNTTGRATAAWDEQSYSNTGVTAQTITGFYVTDTANLVLLWVENFPVALALAPGGAALLITPRLTLRSEN